MRAWSEKELEFRSYTDDAWYSVRVILYEEEGGRGRLRVRYSNFPADNDAVFDASNFDTSYKLQDFRSRFRQVSVQLQDIHCHRVHQGTKVCVSHAFTDHDVTFYDALIEQVKREKHRFANEEEECLCSFIVVWEHGPYAGLLTEKKIESICIVQSSENLDPNVASFIKIAQERIEAAALKSGSDSDVVSRKESRSSTFKKEIVSKSSNQGTKHAKRSVTDFSPHGEGGRINNLQKRNRQDADVGGVGNYYTILIENLETELSPSTIIEFIHQQTSITIQAYVFPSLPSESYTRGVIMVNFEKDLEDLSDFLNYPDHFIISSRGRPWVVAKNFSRHDTFRASIGTPMFASQRKQQNGHSRISNELKVVRSGTEEYKTAKELRDLLVEFTTHQEGLHKSLAFEERKILRRSAAL